MAATILIADDEAFIVDLVAPLLEDEGHRVLRAYDGQGESPQLVLAAVTMPRLSDIAPAHRLRERENGTGQIGTRSGKRHCCQALRSAGMCPVRATLRFGPRAIGR